MRIFFTLFLALLCHQALPQQRVLVLPNGTDDVLLLGQYASFIEDSTGSWTIDDVRTPERQALFKTGTSDVFNFGNSTSAFWFRLTVNGRAAQQPYLEIGNPMLDSVSFFIPQEGGYVARHTGARLPLHTREVHVNSLLFALPTDSLAQNAVYYFRVKSDYPLEVPISIGEFRPLMERQHTRSIAFSVYMGIMLSMALYNLFIYFLVKDRVYIIYSAFTFTIGLFYLHLKGYMFFLFWGNMPWLNAYTPLFSSVATIFMLLFATHFIEAKRYAPRLYKGSFAFHALFVLCVALNIFGNYGLSAALSQVGALLLSLYVFAMAMVVWRAGNPMARFYLTAWSIYLCSVIVLILQVTSAIPSNTFTSHSVFFGTAAEVILLSFALAYRINRLKKEKEAAQHEVVRLVKDQNEVLEKKVQEKTIDLKNAYEELQSINEELYQTQEEITAQRDFIEQKNKALIQQNGIIEEKNNSIMDSLRYAETIQRSILPANADINASVAEHFVIFKPKDVVSGDFYWFTETNGYISVAVADCTGHGVPGAFMSLIGNDLLNNIVLHDQVLAPDRVLSLMHSGLRAVLQQDRQLNSDGMDISLCVIKYEDGDNVTVHFAGAKRTLYFTEEGILKEEKGYRSSVGGRQREAAPAYTSKMLTLKKGDCLYLHTDGLADQNGHNGTKYGSKRLRELLADIHPMEMKAQEEAILNDLSGHQQELPQRDDITLMGIRL